MTSTEMMRPLGPVFHSRFGQDGARSEREMECLCLPVASEISLGVIQQNGATSFRIARNLLSSSASEEKWIGIGDSNLINMMLATYLAMSNLFFWLA